MDKGLGGSVLGAVIGWRRFPAPHGAVLRVQTVTSLDQAHRGHAVEHDLVLNVLQLRALGEDLIRAADEREGRERPHARRWWMF